MITFVVPGNLWLEARVRLFASSNESCAVFLTRPGGSSAALVVHDEVPVPDDAYSKRSPVTAELKAAFLFDVVGRARLSQSGLLFVHTHPAAEGQPLFSDIDDAGETSLKPYLNAKLPGRLHASCILAPEGCRARLLCGEEVRVKEVGAGIHYLCDPDQADEADYQNIYDRQVRAFGAAGQHLISRTKVGLVGVGGTGSIMAQELAFLGVQNFVLIDDKKLDYTNLNRVVGAEKEDIGRAKVEISQRLIMRVNAQAQVDPVRGSILDISCRARLADCDFLFICSDNHASRLEACRFSYRNLIPAIDIGVAIAANDGRVESIAGRVQMIAPGLPCLICTKSISADAVRRETMGLEQQAADPYFGSGGEPQPAVISLNATISSLAVTMFLSAITGLPVEARHLRYDGLRSKVYPLTAEANPTCLICSRSGELGTGLEAVP